MSLHGSWLHHNVDSSSLVLQCELLTVEKASLASGLEDKEGVIGRLQQDQACLQSQVSLCHQQVAKLQAQLLQVSPPYSACHNKSLVMHMSVAGRQAAS